MLFEDRRDAALQLLPLLEKYKHDHSILFAVPRGGVPLGFVIARHINFPLEVLLCKKIGHPLNKELAIGAVTLEDYEVQERYQIPASYVQQEVELITSMLRERYHRFMGTVHRPPEISGRTVIIVDDGIATGSTILSAIKILRRKNPAKIVVAVPVAAPGAVELIEEKADELVCLYTPTDFRGVGQFYSDFTQVTDEEVMQLLRDANHFGSVA